MLGSDLQLLRARLFVVAYKMTRSVFQSDDIVQDVLLDFTQRQPSHVNDVQKYLAKAVIYKSLDVLSEKQRLSYVGVDLPEPITDPTRLADIRHDVSFGTLLLIQQLNPLERAVFVLRECFEYSYEELSNLLQLSGEHCRQLLHRAREKMQTRTAKPLAKQKIIEFQQLFIRASADGEMEEFIKHLRDDIQVFADGGGKVKAALHPIVGKTFVLAYMTNLRKKFGDDFLYQPTICNGQPAVVMISKQTGQIDTLGIMEIDENKIVSIYLLRNPDKLTAVRLF